MAKEEWGYLARVAQEYPISNAKYQMPNDEEKRIGYWIFDIGY